MPGLNDSRKRDPANVAHPGKRPYAGGTGFPSAYSRRYPVWKSIRRRTWNDWRWQMQNAIRTVEDLRRVTELSEVEARTIADTSRVYPMVITPHYLSLIEPGNPNDPIWLQAVPDAKELWAVQDLHDDPLAEAQRSPVPGLIHRYPDRVLLVATEVCPVYCRHCFRKRLFRPDNRSDPGSFLSEALEYIRRTPSVREVILSGGDPLMLSDRRLEYLLCSLRAIPHIEVIRIHTRIPVTLPQRLFSRALLRILRKYGPIWMVTHFNHPKELTAEASRAIDLTLKAGVPVNSQTVLLKSINDDPETIEQLVRGLLRMKCRPYYLHHCDPVRGAGHFRTSIATGIKIMKALRGRVSGLAIPTYVVDAPGGLGKVPILPRYILAENGNELLLRTPLGGVVRYPKGPCAGGLRARRREPRFFR